MVSLFQALVLSIIQGVTEWFPISSSGHLALMQEIFGFQDLGFVVYLHFASILSLVIFFGKDIVELLKFKPENRDYMLKIIIALIPAVIVGFLYRENIRYAFGNFLFMGLFFMIFGFFIYSTKNARELKNGPSKTDSLIIGISQVFSLFPGISRSGMTMGTGLTMGLKKEEAIKFSFLLAIPIIIGATLVEAQEITLSGIPHSTLFTSFTVTLLTSLLMIKLLIKIVRNDKFYLFGIYNMILGLIVFTWSFFR